MAGKTAQVKTQEFVWKGKNRRGQNIEGKMVGSSVAVIKMELRKQGITPKTVRKKSASLFGQRKKKITSADITIFTRQLATMLAAGIAMVQAFDIVARGHANPTAANLILKMKEDIESGSTLSEALGKYPKYFNELYCNLVDAGEKSGSLERMLSNLATYKEKTESIKGKIKKALFYPAAVVVVAIIVTIALLIFVIPQFESLFKGFGAELPAMTQAVIDLSQFVQAYWWLTMGSMVGMVYGFVIARERSRGFAHFIDRMMLRIPIIGVILKKAAIARFARTLEITFAAGLPLVDALTSVSGATGNIIFSQATLNIRDNVATGQQLQLCMQNTDVFPNMVVQMVAIGEESGQLEQMLGKIADFYEEQVDNAVDALSSLLEPLIMALLGGIVGSLVIAMYLPIFKLGTVV